MGAGTESEFKAEKERVFDRAGWRLVGVSQSS
jgi:hypothetical protein